MSAYPCLSIHFRNWAKKKPKGISVRLFRFPLGRVPSLLTDKLDPNISLNRRLSLRFRVRSLIELSELDKAAQISLLSVREKRYHGWDTKVMMCNDLISSMCEAKRYDDAIALFHHFFNEHHKVFFPDISTFNLIVKAFCDDNRVDEALNLYIRTTITVLPNMDTRRLLTKGLVDTGRIYDALIFLYSRNLWDSVAYSYIIRGFLDLGEHYMANHLSHELFNKTTKGRAVVDATFVDYWFKQGDDEKAMEVYTSLISRSVCASTGNTLLKILFDNGKETEAWDLFNAMLTNSLTFNRDTLGTVVNACFKLRRFKLALQTFKRPEFTRSSRCYANIIAQFCQHGMMSQAQDLFDEICSAPRYLSPDVPTFRSLINGYAKAGRVDDAVRMLQLMVDSTFLKFAVHSAH
ncbi:hypothetical protein N665_0185s0038 [Sinapis alba]|nr:hypothetical protein N665_0185s0038 [Sinapis alba]